MRFQLVVAAAAVSSAFACSSESHPQVSAETEELGISIAMPGKTKAALTVGTPAKLKPTLPCSTFEASIRGVNDRLETRKDLDEARDRWGHALTNFDRDAMKRAYVLPCEPRVNLSKVTENPENVRLVMSILPESKWDDLTTFLGAMETGPIDRPSFSYLNFLRVVARMPYFCGEAGTFGTIEEACQRELASLFAHSAQETGAHRASSSVPEFKQAFAAIRELDSYDANAAYDPGQAFSPAKCVAPFLCPASAHYYGRGIKQLTHFYNYAAFSAAFLGDPQALLSQPDRVAREGYLAIASGIWFHMTPRPPTPSMHDVLIGRYRASRDYGGILVESSGSVADRFEATVSVMNGEYECSPPANTVFAARSNNRFRYYKSLLDYFGAQKTGIEASYDATTVCKIVPGNPWVESSIRFAPNWYFDTAEGTCQAQTYETQPSLALVTEGLRSVCTKMFAKSSTTQKVVW